MQTITFTEWLLNYADSYIRSLPLEYQYDMYLDAISE